MGSCMGSGRFQSQETQPKIQSGWLTHTSRIALVTWLFSSMAPAAYAQPTPAIIGSAVPIEKADIGTQPLSLLARFPEAGSAMAQYVAQALARAPSLVDAILSVIDVASPQQASAIGAGLVRGLRVMEAKNPSSASTRVVAEKVSKSNNMWLKTTFGALGPSYSSNAPLILPDPIPPAQPNFMYVGTELPEAVGRVGPTDIEEMIPFKRIVLSGDSNFLTRHGMIVAIMASDDDNNGAVSTSPTL